LRRECLVLISNSSQRTSIYESFPRSRKSLLWLSHSSRNGSHLLPAAIQLKARVKYQNSDGFLIIGLWNMQGVIVNSGVELQQGLRIF
jgi:hypothetical protein